MGESNEGKLCSSLQAAEHGKWKNMFASNNNRAGAGRKYNAAVCAMSGAAEDARVNIYEVFRTVSST